MTNGDVADLQPVPFGKAMREWHFHFDPSYTPINNGAFGTFPTYVRNAQRKLQADLEARPDAYLRYGYTKDLLASRRVIAGLLNADLSDIVVVQNATTGYNTLLRSIVWQPGDHIIYYEAAYGTFSKLATYIDEITPATSHCLGVRMPCSDDELVTAFEREVREINAREGCRVRVAAFDTLTSMPAIRIPFERLLAKCRELGVFSLVDGAHGLGLLPLDLKALDPDFFVTNAHKWFFVPRGCAVMYIPKRNQALIRTSLPTSWAFVPADEKSNNSYFPTRLSPYEELFEWVGTIDCQNYLVVPAAKEWREKVCGGEEKIQSYVNDIARRAGDRVAEILGTDVMDCAGTKMRDVGFSNVRLPLEIGDGEGQIKAQHQLTAKEFLYHYSSVVLGSYFQCMVWHGVFYWRLSGQIYLDMEDFERVGEQMKKLCEDMRKSEDTYLRNGTCRLCVEESE